MIDIEKNPANAFRLFYLDFDVNESSGAISSWTVGRNKLRPKWHFMTKFLSGENYWMAVNFNWADHLSKFALSETVDAGVEPSDEILVGTPMVGYLERLRDAALALRESIAIDIDTQTRLLSDTIFKRPAPV